MSNPARAFPTGTTVRALFQNCQCDPELLNRPESVIPLMQQAVRDVRLNDLNFTHWAFDGGGCTLAFILSESHVAMHTWPEFNNLVLIDVSVCDFRLSNRARTIALVHKFGQIFMPTKILQEIEHMIPRLEELTPRGIGQVVEVDDVLIAKRTAFQDVIVADTPGFGRVLTLDGVVQATDFDSAFYHEPFAHVPLLSHSNPKNIAILGGCDGGLAKEVLRHPTVEKVVIVERDGDVVNLAKELLKSIHCGSFDSPKVSVITQDPTDFIESFPESSSKFDCILMDTTDPGIVGDDIYDRDTLTKVRQLLLPDGYLVLHIGALFDYPEKSSKVVHAACDIFNEVYPFWQAVSSFGMMVFLLCHNSGKHNIISYPTVKQRLESRGLKDMQVISLDNFHALFSIPPRFRSLLPGVKYFSIASQFAS